METLSDLLTKALNKINPKAVLKCIEKDGKQETISCGDAAGAHMSTTTGKLQKLEKWVSSKKCQIKTVCKKHDQIQAKNPQVTVKCINDMGKMKSMSCSDKDGNLLSTHFGKVKDLMKWVSGFRCQYGDYNSRSEL